MAITSFQTAIPTKSGGNTGLIVLGLAAAAVLGYYFLVHKPAEEAKLKSQHEKR